MAVRTSVRNRTSRYVQGGETDVYPKRLGWWERDIETFQYSTDDLFVKLAPQYDKRPDAFAADYFGQAGLQWVVLQYNSIVDINEEFRAGKTIRVPEASRVKLGFLNKRTGGKKVA
jgi:hypothetical protein